MSAHVRHRFHAGPGPWSDWTEADVALTDGQIAEAAAEAALRATPWAELEPVGGYLAGPTLDVEVRRGAAVAPYQARAGVQIHRWSRYVGPTWVKAYGDTWHRAATREAAAYCGRDPGRDGWRRAERDLGADDRACRTCARLAKTRDGSDA